VDLFEPGSGSQIHDFNSGILASGLFWTLPMADRALRISRDERRAVLRLTDVPVLDSFQFFGPNQTPATVSFQVEWRARGAFVDRGSGKAVAAEDRTAFNGRIAPAVSMGRFSGSELGFRFRSNSTPNTARGWAQVGRERNGAFL
jgi:hypothetical protein